MMKDLKTLYRNTKNTILQLPEIEIKVRDATSNEKWGPTGTQMKEIAQATHSYSDFPIIMNTIWKRINDPGRLWRHIYKSLLLLDYLLKNGSEQVIRETRVHLIEIQTLTQFQHIDEHDKDQGVNVRERAKQIVELLHDDNRIKGEREKALKNRDKYEEAIEGGVGAYGRTNYNNNTPNYGQNYNNYGNQNYDDYSTKPPDTYNDTQYSGTVDDEINELPVRNTAATTGPSGARPRAPSDGPTPAAQPKNSNDLFSFDTAPTPTQPNQSFGQPTQPNQPFGQPTQPNQQFGQPTFGQPNQPFGQPNQPFGQQTQPNQPFGQQTQPNQPFGQPTQPFGQPNQPFGQPNQPFGQQTQPNQTSFANFGQPTQPNQPFGQQNQPPFGSFGQPNQQNEDFFNPRNSSAPVAPQNKTGKPPETEWADFTSYSGEKPKEDPWAQNKLFNLSNLGAKPSQQQSNKVPMGAAKPVGQTYSSPYSNPPQTWGVPPANNQPFGQPNQPFGQPNQPFGQPTGQTQSFKW